MQIAHVQIPKPIYDHPVEIATIERIKWFSRELVEDYLQKSFDAGSYLISRDAAKLLFPEFRADRTANNRFTDAAASTIADAARRTLLMQTPIPGRSQVVILTGAPASGKTGSVGPRFPRGVFIYHETILTSSKRASELIHDVLKSGRLPSIRLFYTDDPRLNVQRMIERARRIGRTVPISYMAATYVSVPQLVAELVLEFGDRLRIQVTNNSETPALAVHHHRMDRALYHVSRYTQESALEAMHGELSRISAGGDPISPGILHEAGLS